jgi:hypothetical protein
VHLQLQLSTFVFLHTLVLCSTTSTPPSITDKRAQQRLCYSTSGTTAVRHAPLTPWDSHCKWGHGLSANAYSTTRWASQSPVDNETADVPETEANPSGPQTDTKTGPQISNSPRQRLTPHHVQLPSPQIDPYREQTKGTPLHPVSVPSASILCHGTAQIIRTKVQKQSPEQLNSRT